MDVYIKGMKMPKRCGRCDMRIPVYDDGIFDHYECCITAATIDNLGEKMDDCPLVPVPSHGRLGDLDALAVHKFFYAEHDISNADGGACYRRGWDDAIDAIMVNAPTIIPASEGE